MPRTVRYGSLLCTPAFEMETTPEAAFHEDVRVEGEQMDAGIRDWWLLLIRDTGDVSLRVFACSSGPQM